MAAQLDAILGYATDAGRGSKVNQDKLGFYLPDDPRLADLAGQFYVVVDGMGSKERGAALADLAIRVVVRAYYAAVIEHGRADALAVAISAADRALRTDLAERPDDADAGCALAAAVLRGDELLVGHVGDCRAYLVRDGRPYRLTDDVADEAVLGRGAAVRPVITDAIPLGPGDRILVCSDGLHQLVAEPQLAELSGAGTPPEAAEKLVAAANARGGWDNITALVVDPFATASRPAPVAPPPSVARAPQVEVPEIEWRKVGIASGLILAAAALVIFRPWQRLGMADAVAGVFAHPTPTLVPPTPLPSATDVPTAVPTETPRPTAAVVGVPELVSESTVNALQALSAVGLEPEIIRQYSPTVAPGFVISQDPRGGAEVAPGSTVQVAISIGPAPAPTRPVLRAWPTWTAARPTAAVEVTVAPTEPPTAVPGGDDGDRGGGGGGGRPKPTSPPEQPPEPTSPPPAPTDKPQPPTEKPPPAPDGVETPSAPTWTWRPAGRGPVVAAVDVAAGAGAARAGLGLVVSRFGRPAARLVLQGATPSATASTTVSATATLTPTNTPTPTDTPTPTNTPTKTPTPTDTPTPTNTPTPTPTPTMPAYLPLLVHQQWQLCTQPWFMDDQTEPNDRRTGAEILVGRNERVLCPRTAYSGRLRRADGVEDVQDNFVLTLRRSGGIKVYLKVPPRSAGDLDLYLYPLSDVNTRRPNWYSDLAPGQDELVQLPGRELAGERHLWVTVWGLGKEVAPPYQLCYEYDGDNRCLPAIGEASRRQAAQAAQRFYPPAATRKVSAWPR